MLIRRPQVMCANKQREASTMQRQVARFTVALIVLCFGTALLTLGGGAMAEDKGGPGNLTGVVFNSSGDKPMTSFTVKLVANQPITDKGRGPKQHGLNDGFELFAEQQIGA